MERLGKHAMMSMLCSLIRWQGRLSKGAVLKELQNDLLGIHNHRA